MRLDEVLTEPTFTSKELRGNSSMVKRNTPSSHILNHKRVGVDMHNSLEKNNKSSVLGKGSEAIVFQSGKPNQVGVARKWLRNQSRDVEKNPAIRFLIKSQQANNTALPRVYSIKQFKYFNDKYDFMIEMEKLSQTMGGYLDKNIRDPHMMYPLWSQIFRPEVVDRLDQQAITSLDEFKRRFERAVAGKDKHLLNSNFRGALELVQSLLYRIENSVDLHKGNFMIRLTSTGPQLVITDPVISN